MVALSVAAFGVFGCLPVFWTLPTAFLSGAAAAGGIAIINAIGNLSGFFGPYLMGYLKDLTGTYEAGLQSLAALGFIAMLIVLVLRHNPALERAPNPPSLPRGVTHAPTRNPLPLAGEGRVRVGAAKRQPPTQTRKCCGMDNPSRFGTSQTSSIARTLRNPARR